MAEDLVAAELAQIREVLAAVRPAFTLPLDGVRASLSAGMLLAKAEMMLGALDATLKHHKPAPSYGRAFDGKGNPRCTHDPDKDHGEHLEDGYGEWYCTDLVEGHVCASCGEDDGCGLLPVNWQCATYRGILAALKGGAPDAEG